MLLEAEVEEGLVTEEEEAELLIIETTEKTQNMRRNISKILLV